MKKPWNSWWRSVSLAVSRGLWDSLLFNLTCHLEMELHGLEAMLLMVEGKVHGFRRELTEKECLKFINSKDWRLRMVGYGASQYSLSDRQIDNGIQDEQSLVSLVLISRKDVFLSEVQIEQCECRILTLDGKGSCLRAMMKDRMSCWNARIEADKLKRLMGAERCLQKSSYVGALVCCNR